MVEVYIDGASAGDPGPSGGGIFIKMGNGEVQRYSVPLGVMSNHEAEYATLIKALEICLDNHFEIVSVRTDSQLVCDGIEKRYVKKNAYRELHEKALELSDQLPLFFIKWIPGKANKTADELARKAIKRNPPS
ncbi:reverse transcriptase-like protein [Pseudalkalibacillus caeni]|uniref:Reverse transcriptase-like protein n=1 Tax=Exobacillus caeni TaxID=2574798 RepID=A0A5R9F4T3_9BACL|nr:reverse transcriptase-like protein [Pseudalkalibacillus caeni]TLS37499.1 reverse transcriptase-like protein [Pseudalkalibacillus caeni]